MKILQFFQYAYLVFAAIFIFEAVSKWGVDRNRSYMAMFFAALAIFMFFFRKRFKDRFKNQN